MNVPSLIPNTKASFRLGVAVHSGDRRPQDRRCDGTNACDVCFEMGIQLRNSLVFENPEASQLRFGRLAEQSGCPAFVQPQSEPYRVRFAAWGAHGR
jgi:hypothetical protein